ncbi:class I SAM-dependent methyltransferase [Methylobacterium isbiliense]|jgi:phosphatidylethanolamine/phosphatidyl-N-methylethanolamine N-methyltransferase|uniref:2-methoxy-6-polyprenyl-1,4-benzoquinol methylase, mitochondrial n=1 Tax=Methylobacterium isbiliense TaxID=315478 RepID=A0ABQ4SFZ1_9HYPH|nr:methyltransferase domain-containing protein [Methylobacterium isbiliense]MDN3624020.1 methyltransferase domain-containing protein [Methylobacterium isbiliense]GJE02054.1 2-methoxy-6-polyprenyl-1,4-benzoquinol methylase, mitochondrial [Methylobacterium isbiliense]
MSPHSNSHAASADDLPARDLDTDAVARAYGRWAPVYDMVFGRVFARGRSLAIEAAERAGGRVLEVGVGTGISLPAYRRSTRLFGVDISEPMLAKARERVRALRLQNVEGLAVMDAERLDFPDGAFDVVVAQYVVTAVPNPEAALTEFARVLRPGGEIVITTRIGAEGGLRGVMEKAFSPVANRLGWRTEFSFARYARWAEAHGIAIVERRPLPPLGHFCLLRLAKPAR